MFAMKHGKKTRIDTIVLQIKKIIQYLKLQNFLEQKLNFYLLGGGKGMLQHYQI